jgi:hypothetical protein
MLRRVHLLSSPEPRRKKKIVFFNIQVIGDLCCHQNPRMMQIRLRMFRRWKTTMEYLKTIGILYVREILGHKSINNTLLCTQLVTFRDNEFTARVAHSEKKACQLIETGFEYVCGLESKKLFRKCK